MIDGNLELAEEDFDAVLSLLDDSSQSDLNSTFKYSRCYGRELLAVQQYVGLIRTHTGCQFEILPKISKKVNPDVARALLVKMLIKLVRSPFKEGVVANLHAHDMPLFEILMWQFLEHVRDIVRKGIARTYVGCQDNLLFLRGKLQVSEHIRRNLTDRSRFYCEFDEYETNRPTNRLIKRALEIVYRLTRDPLNQQYCREFLFWFDRVPGTQDYQRDFQAVQRDRLVQHYQAAMPICRLILSGLNPLIEQGDRRALSLLFPMHEVFENYVSGNLRETLKGWSVNTQIRGQALIEEHDGKKFFHLAPDLELRNGEERVIGDIKWKLLNSNERNYGISQSDVYQLFAYSKKYLSARKKKIVLLIYPRTDDFEQPLPPFWYQKNEEVLHVLPYDLHADKLIEGAHFSLEDMSDSARSGVAA